MPRTHPRPAARCRPHQRTPRAAACLATALPLLATTAAPAAHAAHVPHPVHSSHSTYLSYSAQHHPEPVEPDAEDLDQTVSPDEENVDGEAVLSVGHVDIGPRFVDGTWRIQGRDDAQDPPVWRGLADVVTLVSDEALLDAPDSDDFDFIDAEPGSPLHVIPQTQNPEVIWLGWNTQDPEVMDRADRGVTLTMHGVTGPGHFSVFLQNGDLGAPDVLWDSATSGPQDLWVDLNTHTHANWVFTEPGVYVVDFEVSAELIGGERVTDRAPLRFAVGDTTDPQEAFDAANDPADPAQETSEPQESPEATAPADAGDSSTGGSTADSAPAAEDRSPLGPVLPLVGAGMLVLLTAAAWAAARARRARRTVEQETADRTPGADHSSDVTGDSESPTGDGQSPTGDGQSPTGEQRDAP